MKWRLVTIVAVGVLVAACGSADTDKTAASGATDSGGDPPAAGTSPAGGQAGDEHSACRAGLTGNEPGVVNVSCDGSAEIRVRAGADAWDVKGGHCATTGDYFSASAGVIVDVKGLRGAAFKGRPPNAVTVNNTDTPGKGTIQVTLDGKNLFDLGEATLSLPADRKSAHLTGTSGKLSDSPGTKITVDITC